jgi:hypothetical protein
LIAQRLKRRREPMQPARRSPQKLLELRFATVEALAKSMSTVRGHRFDLLDRGPAHIAQSIFHVCNQSRHPLARPWGWSKCEGQGRRCDAEPERDEQGRAGVAAKKFLCLSIEIGAGLRVVVDEGRFVIHGFDVVLN